MPGDGTDIYILPCRTLLEAPALALVFPLRLLSRTTGIAMSRRNGQGRTMKDALTTKEETRLHHLHTSQQAALAIKLQYLRPAMSQCLRRRHACIGEECYVPVRSRS